MNQLRNPKYLSKNRIPSNQDTIKTYKNNSHYISNKSRKAITKYNMNKMVLKTYAMKLKDYQQVFTYMYYIHILKLINDTLVF